MAIRGYITLANGEQPYVVRTESFAYLGNFATFEEAQKAIQVTVAIRQRFVQEDVRGVAGAWRAEDAESPTPLPVALGGNLLSLDARKGITLSGSQVILWKDQMNRQSFSAPVENSPVYQVSPIDGRPEVRFMPASTTDRKYLLLRSQVIDLTQSFTVAGIGFGQTTPNTDQKNLFTFGTYLVNGNFNVSSAGNFRVSVRQVSPSQVLAFIRNNIGGTVNAVLNFASGGPDWFAFMVRCDGVPEVSLRHSRNPGAVATGVRPAAPIATDAVALGRGGAASAFRQVSLATLDVYQRALDVAEWTDQLLPYYQAQFPRCIL